MGIIFDENSRSFLLQTEGSTYIIKLIREKYLAHVYWGNKISQPNPDEILMMTGRCSFHPNPQKDWFSNDTLPQEYPSYGNADLRIPAYQIQLENGTRITDLSYESYRILQGKPALTGLPHTHVNEAKEAQTLEVDLIDSAIGLRVILSYTIFTGYDAIIRSARFINEGSSSLRLLRAFSLSMDFPDADYDMISLSGSWARERHLIRRSLDHGSCSIESRRGASSHSENPFIALCTKNADECTGNVYGFSLIYSGNFYAGAEIDQYNTTRVSMGINPFDFSWLLEPGENFVTPEAVMVYSVSGFGAMSRCYHRLYRNHLSRSKYSHSPRPILINNWEATYFNFNEEKILSIAKEAKSLGIEMLVLDDGWFGKRNDDTTSLGDWFVNKEKLPDGIGQLAAKVNKIGLKFGLWFEPEMVSPKSELYQAHPDWILHVPDYASSTARHQYILDYSREDVQNYIITVLSDVLGNASISYVKWDMNRNMSEIGSSLLPPKRQMETAHRYMLGLYHVMDVITSRFPDVLFESCSGGGGRFDPGILYYMPQNWTSDDTDGVERLKIQYGTSMVYPSSAMTAHVSAVPNHQTDRITPLKFRSDVAMSGNFGYELDVTKMSPEEKKEVSEQVEFYKEIRELVQYGDFYRLQNPFEGNDTAWMYVSEDKTKAILFVYSVLAIPNAPYTRVKLQGLQADYFYQLKGTDTTISGEQLLSYGINTSGRLQGKGDFKSSVLVLTALQEANQ